MKLEVNADERAILLGSLEETLRGMEDLTGQSRTYMAVREPGIALLLKASEDLGRDQPPWALEGTRASLRALLERQVSGASHALVLGSKPAGAESLNREDPGRTDEMLDITSVAANLLRRLSPDLEVRPRRKLDTVPAGSERWTQPLDLAALGELTALWLEGKGWGPWHVDGAPPDDETVALVPYLAAMNRSGYATDFSQPGQLGRGWSQRAAVTGYCAHPQADCLAALSLESELIVITEHPGAEADFELPITQGDGRAFTRLCGRGVFDEPDALWDGCHPLTWALLATSHYVAICDPLWGREDLLWPSVVAALAREPLATGGLLSND